MYLEQSDYFIDTLRLEKWKFNTEDNSDAIPLGKPPSKQDGWPTDPLFTNEGPNLNLLIANQGKNGAWYSFKDIYRRTFAWYIGSMASPPCKEGVQHFIMEQPIFIPKLQFQTLKDKVYQTLVETNGNARKYRPTGTRKVFVHTDYGTKCADAPIVPFDDDDDQVDRDNVKGPMTLDLTGIKATYLKSSNIITSYGVIFVINVSTQE